MIENEYKSFICVQKLEEQNKNRFYNIVNSYAEELNDKIVMDGSVYTIHNFNNHCMDLYKIISEVLLDSKRAYEGVGLTDKELYILDLAVLFHDISMSQDITSERENHSRKSAEYIQQLYDNKESAFFKNCGLSLNEIKALKAVIMAHSDIKDGSVPPDQRGLNSPKLNNKMAAKIGNIRGILLAGILRLADELDVTVDRLGNTSIEENLRKAKKKYTEIEIQMYSGDSVQIRNEFDKYKKYVESLEHWENLHLFSEVRRQKQDDIIYLVTDDEHLEQLINEGNTPVAISRRLVKVYEKISSEWEGIKQKVFEESSQKLDIRSFFPISNIKIECNEERVNKELRKQLNNVSKVKESFESESAIHNNISAGNTKNVHHDNIHEVILLDQSLSDKITGEIKKRHLLKVGHFILNSTFCARDWIDTKEIIETKAILNEIVGKYIEDICTTCDLKQKYIIVGLDLEGALLASRVGMGTKMPFSYIIPVKDQSSSSTKELEISIKDYDKLILMADSIVTFDTIKRALDGITKSNGITQEILMSKIEKIYTIFYRKSNQSDLGDMECFKEKTFCINMEFPIELFPKDNCSYVAHGECLALNNRLQLN